MALAVWQATIVDGTGDFQASAQVEVRLEGSGALAALYSDRDGGDALANPFSADEAGFARFYAAGGAYRIDVTKGAFSKIWRHVAIGLLSESDNLLETQVYIPLHSDETGAGLDSSDIVSNAYPVGHVYRYGENTTPGTTDMTTAFQNASLASLHPYAPPSDFLITAAIPLRGEQHWFIDGGKIIIASNTITVFEAHEVDGWTVKGLRVVGDGTTTGTAKGIDIRDCRNWRVEEPHINNVRGWGIYLQPGSNTTERSEHGVITNPRVYDCYVGLQDSAGAGVEYYTIINPHITGCSVAGMILSAGNGIVLGGHIVDNVLDGIIVGSGSNHAHGIVMGTNINHNGQYGVHCDNVVNGHTFSGCHIYENSVFLEESAGILFDGGIIDCAFFNYKGASSGMNRIRGAWMPSGGTGFTRSAGANDGHDELIVTDCWGPGSAPSGITVNDVSTFHVYAHRATGSTQSLSSGVATDLVFNTETFDRREAYNNSTGVTTIPTDGLYRIKANCLFSGTAMDVDASFVNLRVDGTSRRIGLAEIFSTTLLRVAIDEEIYLNTGDTVVLTGTIVGTSPTFGNGTWESYLSIERVA